MRFWTTHQSKTKRRVLLAMLLGYLELRGNYKTSTRARRLSIKAGQNRRRRAKGVKKSGGVSGKSFIPKPLTVILNLTQRGEWVQQAFSVAGSSRFTWGFPRFPAPLAHCRPVRRPHLRSSALRHLRKASQSPREDLLRCWYLRA